MESEIIKELKIKCAEAGTNLSEICRDSGVPRSTVERWRSEIPSSITNLQKLEDAIEIRKQKNSAES